MKFKFKLVYLFVRVVLACVVAAVAFFLWSLYSDPHTEEKNLKIGIEETRVNIAENALLQRQRDDLLKRMPRSAQSDSLMLNSTVTAYKMNEQRMLIDSLAKGINNQRSQDGAVFMVNAIKSILGFIASVPFVMLVVILAIISNRSWVRAILVFFRSFKTVEALGAKVELSDETKADLEDTVKEAMEEVKFQYDLWQQQRDIRPIFELVVSELKTEITRVWHTNCSGLRFTLHVPDLLFQDRLYQLLDYYPGGEGRGRTFSTRYGIIGRSWRLKQGNMGSVSTTTEQLIREWGMTKEEAQHENKKSVASIVLTGTNGVLCGVLYMDSAEAGVFGTDQALQDNFCTFVQTTCAAKNLIALLSDRKDIINKVLLIDFFK